MFRQLRAAVAVVAVVLAGTVGVLMSSAAPASAATGTLDQYATTVTNGVGGATNGAQTFTPGVTGVLTQVDVYIWRSQWPSADFVQIRNVVNGYPTGAVLASSVHASGTYDGWYSLSFDKPPYLVAGTQYALLVMADNGMADMWGYDGDTYAGGQGFSQTYWSGQWSAFGGDWAFRTYMAPVTVYYVAPDGMSTGSCDSWSHACSSLSYALGQAQPDDLVWVAAGTYTPDTTGLADTRTATFPLENGVTVYGGFAGNESAPEQRNPQANVTVLSGDIGVAGDATDNAYHVVTGSGTDASAILDGFTVTAGNADLLDPDSGFAAYPDGSGAGMLVVSGAPTVTNVKFIGNSAVGWGGGVFNDSGSPRLTNVAFSDNSTEGAGGGMGSVSGSASLANVTFTDNSAVGGGGMAAQNDQSTLSNVTFSANTAGTGGGMVNDSGDPTLANVTFTGNTATSGGGGGFENTQGSPTFSDVTFSDNTATQSGGGFQTMLGTPLFFRVTFSGNLAEDYGGGADITGSSAAFTDVTFSGNLAGIYGGAVFSVGAIDPTFASVTFSGNSATSGAAMFNARGSQPVVTNSILWGDDGTEVVNLLNGRPSHQTNTTFSYSDVAGSGGSGDSWQTAFGTDGGNNIDVDPVLGTLGRYPSSASTLTLPLLPGSPAINTGTNTGCPSTDQRGLPRPQTTTCDMGAYETQRFTMQYPSGSGQSAIINHTFAYPLSVLVMTSYNARWGDPVVGGKVTFTSLGTGAGATFDENPVTIGQHGTASVIVTANGIEGHYGVRASAAGSASANFSLTNLPKNTPSFAFDLSGLPAKTYGDPGFSVAGYATKPAGDNGEISFRTTADSVGCSVTSDGEVTITGVTTDVGTCTIEALLAEDSDYVAAGPISQSFTIAPAPLTVVPTSGQSMVYGSSPPDSIGYDLTGFVNGETETALRTAGALSGAPDCSVAVSATSAVDTYPITCTTGSLSASNYTIAVSAQTVTFAVTPATLTITPDSGQSMVYGSGPPANLPHTLSGFVNGETDAALRAAGALSGQASCSAGVSETSPVKAYPITCTAGSLDAANYTFTVSAQTVTFAVTPATLTVTAENKQVQYSDLLPALTYTIAGFVNGETAVTGGVTGAPILNTSATISGGNVLSAPGTYAITITKGTLAADNYVFSFVGGTLTVTQEDARAYYNGNMLFWGTTTSAASASVTLTATIKDITAVSGDPSYDAYRGDISHATVSFVNRDTSAVLTGCSDLPVALVSSSEPTVGTVTCKTTLPIGSSGGSQYTIGIVVAGYYTGNASTEDTVITVAAPLTSYFITGGGVLNESSSAGKYAADAGSRSNFGFNVKFNKGATNLQGTVNIIFRRGGHTYQIKSNALTSLGEKPSPCTKASLTSACTANFVSKANLQDITNPANPVSLGGNLTFQMSMTDYGTPTKDTIGFSLYQASTLLFSSKWNGTRTVETLLTGGNLSVR